jgi:hypothetical protein
MHAPVAAPGPDAGVRPAGRTDALATALEPDGSPAAVALPIPLIAAMLLALHVAVFANAVWYLPAEADDLRLLSVVAQTEDPLQLFARDAGLTNPVYRPLLSLSLWATYALFDVRSWPHQLISLCLHFVNVCLLAWILLRAGTSRTTVLCASALAVSSLYTVSPAVWVSDRATLMAACCVLLLIAHGVVRGAERRGLGAWWIAGLSALAVLSKESGVIVPLLALLGAAGLHPYWTRAGRTRAAAAALAVLAGYGLVRLAVFGSGGLGYDESGYLLATWHYESAARLPSGWRLWAAVENVVKNLISGPLPVFDNEGGFWRAADAIRLAPLWIPAAVLTLAASRRPWSPLQRMAAAAIVLNAVVHYAAFRHRVQYIPWIALCAFVAASPGLTAGRLRGRTAGLAAMCLLVTGLAWGTSFVQEGWHYRYRMIKELRLQPLEDRYPHSIDRTLVTRILQRYGRRSGAAGPAS